MGPNERKFKPEYARELLNIAKQDLKTAKFLAGGTDIRPENILFHVEQAVEKALKAVLCSLGKPLPMTHDLYAVIDRFDKADLPPSGYGLHDLTPFATVRRYEEGSYELTKEDVLLSLQTAQDVLSWCEKKIR